MHSRHSNKTPMVMITAQTKEDHTTVSKASTSNSETYASSKEQRST
jgi:hypothetical protein